MTTVETISEGKFRITQLMNYTNSKGTWEKTNIVFATEKLASEESKRRCENFGSNLVPLGNDSMEIEGVKYFYPTFNVWD